MKALIYIRGRLKYDFIFVSDDSTLIDAYSAVYQCQAVEISGESIYNTWGEERFRIICMQISKIHPAPFFCALYDESAHTVFSMPGGHNVQLSQNAIRHTKLYDSAARDIHNILQIIENAMYASIEVQSGILALHGAAIAMGGKAVLMLASTSSGKSTLAAFMTLRGYEYITDDEIYVTCSDLRAEGCRKPILLRNGGYNIIRDTLGGEALSGSAEVITGLETRYMIPVPGRLESKQYGEYPAAEQDIGYEIAAVVLLRGYGVTEPYIKKLDRHIAFTGLIKSQLAPCSEDSTSDICQRYRACAALSAKTYEMEYSDLWTAERYLRNLLK